MLIITKPKYIYDYDKLKFKEFGVGNNKQLITLYSIAIISAIIIAIIFLLLSKKKNKNKMLNEKIKYLPIKLHKKNKFAQCIQNNSANENENEYVYLLSQD
jgi:hypothetical protein